MDAILLTCAAVLVIAAASFLFMREG